jgi:hypothetical protein
MTEAEWLAYASPTAMLLVLHYQTKASERKWRLLAVAYIVRSLGRRFLADARRRLGTPLR